MITNNLEYDGITSDHGRSVPFQTGLDSRHGSHLCIAVDRAYCRQSTKYRPEDISKRVGQVPRVAVDTTPNQRKDSMRRPAAVFPIALALGAMILAPRAGAQAQGPTEIATCQTISQPGSYVLVHNLTATGDCLKINSDFVTIDLAGFAIIGSGDGTAIQFVGPTPQTPRRGFAARNGTISGFATGVQFIRIGGTDGAIVEGLRIFGTAGGTAGLDGILVRGAVVRGNTVVCGAGPGTGIRVVNGSVTGNVVEACEDGIDAFDGVVSGNNLAGTGTGISIDTGTAIGNTVTGYSVGIAATCPSNLIDNTATGNGKNLVLSGTGCKNTNNVAP